MRVGAAVAGVAAVGAIVSGVTFGGIGSGRELRPRSPVAVGADRDMGSDRVDVRVFYRPPVRAPIVDGYRPPATPFGPGNRGVDYGTTPRQRVNAAADGVVTFAGQVGGTLHVTIAHVDGVRTSYSFLGAVEVRRGAHVRLGQGIGVAGERPLHLGARRGTAYIDPRTLFADEGFTVRLVPAHRDP